MKIQVRQNLVSKNKWTIKCPYEMDAKYITVHNTGNQSSANNEISYMINNDNQVSYHFAVDDFEVVQGIATNRNAWHAGDGNGNGNRASIGIEICYSKSGGTKYDKAEELAIKFIAQLLKEYGWGINKVKKHQDWSQKYCPHRILDRNGWQSFLNKVELELNNNESEGELMSIEYDELNKRLKKLENPMIYNYIDNNTAIISDDANVALRSAVNKGVLKGNEKGELGLTYDQVRQFVWNYRSGLYN